MNEHNFQNRKRKHNQLVPNIQEEFTKKRKKYTSSNYSRKIIRLYPSIFDPKHEENVCNWNDREKHFEFTSYQVNKILNIIQSLECKKKNIIMIPILDKYKIASENYKLNQINIHNNDINIDLNPKFKISKIKKEIINNFIKKNVNKHTTLKQIVQEYEKSDSTLTVSVETVRKVMRNRLGLRYLRPKLRNYKTLLNSHKCMTAIFLHKMIEIILSGAEIIFIDESNFSNTKFNFKTWTSNKDKNPNYFPGRLKSLNLTLACTKSKVIYYEYNDKSSNSNTFIEILKKILLYIENDEYLKPMYKSGFIYIYADNASIHKTTEVKNYCRSNDLQVIFSPCYRPEFNIIEHCFGFLKNIFYKELINDKNAAIELINGGISKITKEKLTNYYGFTLKKIIEEIEEINK